MSGRESNERSRTTNDQGLDQGDGDVNRGPVGQDQQEVFERSIDCELEPLFISATPDGRSEEYSQCLAATIATGIIIATITTAMKYRGTFAKKGKTIMELNPQE
jgi:hypothetical protein